jgi:hypothetical protein
MNNVFEPWVVYTRMNWLGESKTSIVVSNRYVYSYIRTFSLTTQLVARRLAAFDQSPLNACKLRSLYRTLLTLDFAAKTVERPCQNRRYTDEEWHAYRKSQYGTQAEFAHEVLDQFWLSSTVSPSDHIVIVH